jgi:hypothetical protein
MPHIPFISLSLWRFPFATGGYTPSLYFSRPPPDSISSISRRPSHFSSTTYKMLLPQLLCFDNDPFSWEVFIPLKRSVFRAGSARKVVRNVEDQYQMNRGGRPRSVAAGIPGQDAHGRKLFHSRLRAARGGRLEHGVAPLFAAKHNAQLFMQPAMRAEKP